ncbi:MAG TPA: YfiR family protein [Bryobacteraceae bacterium]|jgi:hypothetical protein|nr:YfiR family protein [Bryobacteraceae bacterium]
MHSPNAVLRRLKQLLYFAVAVTAFVVPEAHDLHAQTPKPTEYEVEAAYLSNFGRFVEWPARAGAATEPFNVCVLGADPFGPLLDAALKGETIAGAPMAAKRISKPEEAASCRIVFVGSVKDSQLNGILQSLRVSNALTVSDMSGFSRRGGMIQFVLDGNRVRFEINLAAVQRTGLTVSSELLKVAQAVRRAP